MISDRKNITLNSQNAPKTLAMIWYREMGSVYVLSAEHLDILRAPHLWRGDRCAFRVLAERLRECFRTV